MKLYVSALFLAATAAFAQNQGTATAVMEAPLSGQSSPQEQAALAKAQAKAQAQMQAMVDRMSQAGCPLYLQSASVTPEAGYLPVTAQNRQDGALDLHFRNESGKPIASASITAQVNVKANVYALDAHPLQLRLTLSGTGNLDKTLDQIQHIALPQHVYLFGVARVTLDQVEFTDGSVWTAKQAMNDCRTGNAGIDRIAK